MRAQAYDEQDEHALALDDYDHVLEQKTDSAWLYGLRAGSNRNFGNYEQAVEDYTRAIQLDSSIFLFYYWRGISYIQLKMFIKAVGDLSQVIDLEPGYIDAYAWRGYAYWNLGSRYRSATRDDLCHYVNLAGAAASGSIVRLIETAGWDCSHDQA